MQAVILAAGSGRRLQPLTLHHSKAMLPIAGQPMVERVIQQLAAAQPESYILVARLGDWELRTYYAARPDVQLVFQEEPLGAAHALLQAAHLLKGFFLLSACDNLTSSAHIRRMVSYWQSQPGLSGLLTVMPAPPEMVSSTAIVSLDGSRVRRIIEKPAADQVSSNIASLPLYIFSTDFLDYLQQSKPTVRGEVELQDAIQCMIDDGKLVDTISIQARLTLTTPDDIRKIEDHLSALDQAQQE